MAFITKALLQLQYLLGQVAAIILAPLFFGAIKGMNYRIRNLKEVRKECAHHFKNHKGPWIFCANHLTMIDSAILGYGMISLGRHMFQFQFVPWNLPKWENYNRSIALIILLYLAKCIPIDRGGNRAEMKKTIDKCTYLLGRKQNLVIFPEGTRSRTGRVNTESFFYGVGRFIKMVEGIKIMCIYLRGDGQETYSTIPRYGERFTMKVKVFTPQKTEAKGLSLQREYAHQIINQIAQMEENYFASCRK
jgi:1-acyl-sn-glycerol-3-phosphate acyltransferase